MAYCFCLCIGMILFLLYLLRRILESLKVDGLCEKPVLITGCDTGFGQRLVVELLRNNMTVFAGCLTDEGSENLKEFARHLPGTLEVVKLDVTSQQSVDNAKKFVQSKVSGLWALVNNAGILGVTAPVDWLTVSDYQRSLDVNTLGVIRVTSAFKEMIKKSKGRIVTASSVGAIVSLPAAATYCVSKFAVEAYCDALRFAMRHFGVTVHILEPGFFNTNLINKEMLENSIRKAWDQTPAEVQQQYGFDYVSQVARSTCETLGRFTNFNSNVQEVIDCYYHAITARFPRKRYRPGLDSKFFFLPLSYMPTGLQDFIFAIFAKLFNAPKPKIAEY